MLFLFFFTKSEEMSRVGSRDRHPRWRSKNLSVMAFKKSIMGGSCSAAANLCYTLLPYDDEPIVSA